MQAGKKGSQHISTPEVKQGSEKSARRSNPRLVAASLLFGGLVISLLFVFEANGQSLNYRQGDVSESTSTALVQATSSALAQEIFPLPLDVAAYDAKMLELAEGTTTGHWPAKATHPNGGAILPFKRIVAYYGNLYSKQMGVLGQYPEEEMLSRLNNEVKRWQQVDPNTPTIPALHYIVTTAQQGPTWDGKYRLRMPTSEIDKVIAMAEKSHALVFLDVQVAKSTLQEELPLLENYLKLPQVHLGIDPEFSMKTGANPGRVIGTMDASDINYAASYLARVVKKYHLPPKILVVHRFTVDMVTNYKKITPLPEVEIVMDMDGWGPRAKKLDTYKQVVTNQPVQFSGFKLFYKNDLRGSKSASTSIMTPAEILKLRPRPSYIQYQ